ncbi:MAG: hypothetical protein HONDAALG_01496 [Gammaproteobacteria bacterium]|nr:hypothetical protein [Gammaproteobacteria bacterium]
MIDKGMRIDSGNCSTVLLDLGDDYSDSREFDLTGKHPGVIKQVRRKEEENGTTYLIQVTLKMGERMLQVDRFLPNPNRFREELTKFGIDLDAMDTSKGLDCSPLIGREVIAVVSSKPTKDGKIWNWITELTPLGS